MNVDLVAITQALREAAEQIRALPDGDLVAMALRAQQASEVGRSPAAAGSGRDVSSGQGSTRATSRRAEAPKSPAPSEEAGESASARPTTGMAARVEGAVIILSKGPLTRLDLLARLGMSKLGSQPVLLFNLLRRDSRVQPPEGRGGLWSLK